MSLTCIAIDDDPLFLSHLEAGLDEIEAFTWLDGFTNPVQAATAIIKLQPDILFIDIEMPYVEGYDLIEWILPRLKELEKLPTIVVISGQPAKIDHENKHVTLHILKDAFKTPEELEKLLSPLI